MGLFRAAVATCGVSTAAAAAFAVAPSIDGASAGASGATSMGTAEDSMSHEAAAAAGVAVPGGIGDTSASASASSNGISDSASCYITNILTPPISGPEDPLHHLGCTWASGSTSYKIEGEVVIEEASADAFLETPHGWIKIDEKNFPLRTSSFPLEAPKSAVRTGILFSAVGDPTIQACTASIGST